jgi:superfamily II DNA helicase RecQ
MEHFTHIFEYLPAYRIAVCKTHQQGIVKSQLEAHLNKKHQEYVWRTRQEIIEAVQKDESLQQWASDPDQIVYPSPESNALPHLPTYQDRLQCQQCGYINRSVKRMQEHCRRKHHWKNSRKAAPGRPSDRQRTWTTVSCQKFHNTNKLGRLFQVGSEAEGPRAPNNADADVSQAIQTSLAQASTQLEELEKKNNNTIKPDTDRHEFVEWLNRAGWARHLKGLKRDWLLKMARKPPHKERALFEVCWAVRMIIWRAQQASKASVVGMPAMMYINRREFGNTTNEKPLNAQQTENTMIKYSNAWVEIIAYIWRTHELPVAKPDHNEEMEGRRPPYRISGRQDKWLQKIKEIVSRDSEEDGWFDDTDSETSSDGRLDEQQQEALEGHVLQFMLSLLDHVLGDNEYTSALISSMAVLGISAESGWLSPLVYTPKQSAVISTSRMLVLYRSTQLRQDRINQLVAEGWGSEDAADIAPPHLEFVQDMANRFMTLIEYNGKPTPMDSILRLRAFGFKIRFTTNAEGVIDWVGDTLLYGNIQFSMPQLRSMIHGMIASARQHILANLMLLQIDSEGSIARDTTACPTIDWGKLVDNAAEQQAGWSFMEDPRNKHATSVEEPKQWLAQRLQNEKAIRSQFIDVEATRAALARGGGVVWAESRIQAYGQAMKGARQELAPLVHMTGGGPPRGSELVTVTYKNSANGDSRGTNIEDGYVRVTTTYHKNIGQTGKSKVIHRYLPREVGELVVYYLWFASPFWHQINGAVHGKAEEVSAYVWEPRPEKSWQKPTRKRERNKESSQRNKRARKDGQVRSNSQAASPEGWDENVDEEPAADPRCGVEIWNANRVKYAMQKKSLQHMGVKLNIMGWRHSSKAIYRRYIHNRAAVKAFLDADEEGDGSDGEDQPFDIQTGHSSNVAGSIYGRPITEPMFSVEARRIGLRLASMEWHAFLQIPSAMSKKARKGTQAAAARKEAVEEEYRRWKMMRLVDVDGELKKLLGEEAAFRSVQKPAIQAIMQHKSPVVAIMGTGAGKSVLFMLPASVSSGVTIVVVPLVALRFDMKERCNQLGLVSAEWDSQRPHEWAQVMFVTPEAAVGEAFGQYINRQRAMGRLDRIVIDECHVVLDSLNGFRSRLLALKNLVRAETQMVYLTATLRPREEQQFIEAMGLPPKRQCQWFRGRTTRKNIRYQVHAYDNEDEQQAIVDLVEGLKEKYPLPGQIVVYCGTVARTVEMAGELGGVCYHRKVGSVEDKKEIVRQLTSGQQQVFTATNALGLGVDAPTIRAVVHIGTVRKMRHYAQESGRAGRDGKTSEAIIMRGYRQTRQGRVYRGFGKDVEEEMVDFIGGQGCMRKVIDKAMDGAEQRWECEEDEEPCQRCVGSRRGREGTEEAAEADRVRVEFEQQGMARQRLGLQEIERQGREACEVEALVELMERWLGGCQWCRACGKDGRGHEVESCVEEEAEQARIGYELFEKYWVIVPYSCCYECRLPQAICSSFEVDIIDGGYRKQAGRGCRYRGVLGKTFVVATMRGGLGVQRMLEQAMQDDGWAGQVGLEEDRGIYQAIVGWGSEKKRWGGIEGNKLSWIIGKVVDFIAE